MSTFKFKEFDIEQDGCAQKVGTDSMVLGAHIDHKTPKKILDIGTGNGVLALMMAQKFEGAQISGVEIQQECAKVAQSNFMNSQFKDRLKVVNADINHFEVSEKFDLIVSNPPFFENALPSSNKERTIARHQSSLRLSDLIFLAEKKMNLNGAFWLIVPKESSPQLIDKSVECGLKLIRMINVFGKPLLHKRDILVFIKTNTILNVKQEAFTIRSNNGEYTDEYKAMTFGFHNSPV